MTVDQLTKRILARIDRDRLAEVASRYGSGPVRAAAPSKYTDADRWVRVCVRRAFSLGLHEMHGIRVLDLGTGAGYFPLICRALGHSCVATDSAQRKPIYRELDSVLGIGVQDLDVIANRQLGVTGAFDLVTAFMVTFNGHGRKPWGAAEWRFFVDDCMRLLVDGGRLVLELNKERDDSNLSEIDELWQSLEATVIGEYRIEIRKT